jgi:hypothetical protein
MNTKILLQIIGMLFINKINAQFNKQWLLSGGGQVSIYNQSLDYKSPGVGGYNVKGNQTNIGLNIEGGYFIFKNISASYKFTYLLWDDNLGNKWKTKAIRNEIIFNKLFPMKNGVFFNLGAAPFYQKYTMKEGNLVEFESVNHGCVFYIGFMFDINNCGLLGINYFKSLDKSTSIAPSKPGIEITYKYIFNKKK